MTAIKTELPEHVAIKLHNSIFSQEVMNLKVAHNKLTRANEILELAQTALENWNEETKRLNSYDQAYKTMAPWTSFESKDEVRKKSLAHLAAYERHMNTYKAIKQSL